MVQQSSKWLDRNFKGINGLGNIDDFQLGSWFHRRITGVLVTALMACILYSLRHFCPKLSPLIIGQTTANLANTVCNAYHKATGQSHEVSFWRFCRFSLDLCEGQFSINWILAPNFVNFRVKSCAFSAHLTGIRRASKVNRLDIHTPLQG